MADTFCVLAWRQLQIQPDGVAKLCCYDDGAGVADSVYRHSIEELWRSPRLREIRREMSDGRAPAGCSRCHESEATTGASLRTLVNRAIEPVSAERLRAGSLASGLAPEPPRGLVLETGNVCNLRCRMCNGRSSSAIEADPVHRAWSIAHPAPPPVEPRIPAPWHRQASFLDEELFSDAQGVRQLQLVGGETFLSHGARMAVRNLVRRGASRQIDLVINTNGTSVDDEWLSLLGEFHSASLAVSLEGVGPWNDYIRYPSRFEEVMASIPRLRTVPRAFVMVSSTFQAYNALSFVKLLELCDELALPIYTHPVQNPPHLAARVLPPAARELAARRLRDYFAARASRVTQVAAEALIPTLDDWGRPWDRELAATFMELTNDLDRSRGQSLASLEPELMEHFAEAGLPWDDRTRFSGAA